MTSRARTDVLLSCGEASGDVYLARVARALRERRPDLVLAGVVGPQGRAEGVVPWAAQEDLGVMGFGEVVRHLPRLRRLGRELERRALQEGVRLLLAVDYPGFHVALAGRLRRAGIPTLDFIPPKTWSWGRWRLGALRRSVRRCAVIFPFEVDHYRAAGIDAEFVGHPLADLHRDQLVASAERREGLLMVPGSRRQELQRLVPVLAGVVERLRGTGWSGPVRVSRAPGVDAQWLAPLLGLRPAPTLAEGPLMGHLQRARAAVVCSGTATMETALAGTPHVIVYRTSALSFAVARALATVEHIGMANIVLGRRAFPEFLQGGLDDRAIASALGPLFLEDSRERRAQVCACEELRDSLGGPGAFARVADLALEMLDSTESGGI